MAAERAVELFEGENADLEEEAKAVLGDDARWWLVSENLHFAGARPIDFIRSDDAAKHQLVRNLLRSIKFGMFT